MPDNATYEKIPQFDQQTEMVLQLNPIESKDGKYYPCAVVKVVPDIEVSKDVFTANPLAPKLATIVSKEGTYDKAALVTSKCVIREIIAEPIDEKPIGDVKVIR